MSFSALSSDISNTNLDVSPDVEFRSLQYALFTTSFVEVLGGLFFLLTALHVVKDREAAERQLQGKDLGILKRKGVLWKNNTTKIYVFYFFIFSRRRQSGSRQ